MKKPTLIEKVLARMDNIEKQVDTIDGILARHMDDPVSHPVITMSTATNGDRYFVGGKNSNKVYDSHQPKHLTFVAEFRGLESACCARAYCAWLNGGGGK